VATLTVGLTGGLASGKSTVARRLARAGFIVVDADRLVAELHRPNAPGARTVEQLLGPELLTPDGAVDKAAVARRVFADSAARERLEAVLFPLVRQRFREIAATAEGVVVLEATKLVESGLAKDFDVVVTVEAPGPIRLARAQRRGLTAAEAASRMSAQAPESLRRAAADLVIENRGSFRALEDQVRQVVAELRKRAGHRPGGGRAES
jgi:dephospho-CoA kinase